MAGFGQQLREAREELGIALEDISQETKISLRVLLAFEAEDFSQLPGGVFAISFLRQYATRVGLNPDAMVAKYRAAAPSSEPTPVRDETPLFGKPKSTSPFALFAENVAGMASRNRSELWSALGFLFFFGLVIAYFVWRGAQDLNALMDGSIFERPPVAEVVEPPVESDAAGQDPVVATPNPAPSAPAAIAQPPRAALPPRPVRLRIQTKGEVWMRARADGRQLFEQVAPAGSDWTIGAERFITLLVGDAGQVDVSWNGEDAEAMGAAGQVRNFVYTPRAKGPFRPKTEDGETPEKAKPAEEAPGKPTQAQAVLRRGSRLL